MPRNGGNESLSGSRIHHMMYTRGLAPPAAGQRRRIFLLGAGGLVWNMLMSVSYRQTAETHAPRGGTDLGRNATDRDGLVCTDMDRWKTFYRSRTERDGGRYRMKTSNIRATEPRVEAPGLAAEDAAVLAERRRAARMRALRARAYSMIELLIVMEVIMILAGMALPGFKTSRKQGYEASAVLALRQLSDAQELYRPRQNPPTYANKFDVLKAAGLIDGDLGTVDGKSYVRRGGYRIIMSGIPDQNSYAFIATAEVQGNTGDRSFYVDQSGLIRMAPDASVSTLSPPLQ